MTNNPKKGFLYPIDAIKFRMEQQGLKQADLVKAGCGLRSHVSEILNKRRKINLPFIRAYHEICDATPLHILIQDYELEGLSCGPNPRSGRKAL